MASGNFLIGYRITKQQFDDYIQPLFKEAGLKVSDKIIVTIKDTYNPTSDKILTAIQGEGNLEEQLATILFEFGKKLEENEQKSVMETDYDLKIPSSAVMKFDLNQPYEERAMTGCVETIGTYGMDKTASELFGAVAQGYLMNSLEDRAKKLNDTIIQTQ